MSITSEGVSEANVAAPALAFYKITQKGLDKDDNLRDAQTVRQTDRMVYSAFLHAMDIE